MHFIIESEKHVHSFVTAIESKTSPLSTFEMDVSPISTLFLSRLWVSYYTKCMIPPPFLYSVQVFFFFLPRPCQFLFYFTRWYPAHARVLLTLMLMYNLYINIIQCFMYMPFILFCCSWLEKICGLFFLYFIPN